MSSHSVVEEKIESLKMYIPIVDKLIHKMNSHTRVDKELVFKLKELHKYLINPHSNLQMLDRMEGLLKMLKSSKLSSSNRLKPEVPSDDSGISDVARTGLNISSINLRDVSTDSDDDVVILEQPPESGNRPTRNSCSRSVNSCLTLEKPTDITKKFSACVYEEKKEFSNSEIIKSRLGCISPKQPHNNKATENHKERELHGNDVSAVRQRSGKDFEVHGSFDLPLPLNVRKDIYTAASTSKEFSASTSKEFSASTSKEFSASTSKEFSASTSKELSASTSKEFSASTSKEFSLTDNLLEFDTSKYKSKSNTSNPLNASAPSELGKKHQNASKNFVNDATSHSHAHISEVNEMGSAAFVLNRESLEPNRNRHESESVFQSFPTSSSVNTGHALRSRTHSNFTSISNAPSSTSLNVPSESHPDVSKLSTGNCRETRKSPLFKIPSIDVNLPVQDVLSRSKSLASSLQATHLHLPSNKRNLSNIEPPQSLKNNSTFIPESRKDSTDNRNSFTIETRNFTSKENPLTTTINFEKIQNALRYLKSLEANPEAENILNQREDVGPDETNLESGCNRKEAWQTIDTRHGDKAIDLVSKNDIGLRDTPEQFTPSTRTHVHITKRVSLPDSRPGPSQCFSYSSNFHSPTPSDWPPSDNTRNSVFFGRESKDNDTRHQIFSSPQRSLNIEELHYPKYHNEELQSFSNKSINIYKSNEPRKLDIIRSRVANGQDKPIQLGQKSVVVSQIEKYKQKREKYPLFSKQSASDRPDNSSNSRMKSFSVSNNKHSASFGFEPTLEGEINNSEITYKETTIPGQVHKTSSMNNSGISTHNNIKTSRSINMPNQKVSENHEYLDHRPLESYNNNNNGIGGNFSPANRTERLKDIRSETNSKRLLNRVSSLKDFQPYNAPIQNSGSDIRNISRDPRIHAQGYRGNNINMKSKPRFPLKTVPHDQSLTQRRHSSYSHRGHEAYVQAKPKRNEYSPALDGRLEYPSLSSQSKRDPYLTTEIEEDENGNNTFQVFQRDSRLESLNGKNYQEKSQNLSKKTSVRGRKQRSPHNHTGVKLAPYSDTIPVSQNSKISNSFTCLIMEGLPSCTNSSHIYKFFDQYLIRDLCIELTNTYKCKGTAYVQFPTHFSAKEALQKENGKVMLNNKIYLRIGYVGTLKQAKERNGVQNFDRERYLDIPSRPIGTGNPFYNPVLKPQPESQAPTSSGSFESSSSVSQKSTGNEKCIEEPCLEIQNTSDCEDFIEEPENDESSTENYSNPCLANVDPSISKRLKNFKIPKVTEHAPRIMEPVPNITEPTSVHDHRTKTVENKTKSLKRNFETQLNSQVSTKRSIKSITKTSKDEITSNKDELKKRKCINFSSNSKPKKNLKVSSEVKKGRCNTVCRIIDSDSESDDGKGDTPTKKCVSKSTRYNVDSESDEIEVCSPVGEALVLIFDYSENESVESCEQNPINESVIEKIVDTTDKDRNMTDKTQPLRLPAKETRDVVPETPLCTTQWKKQVKKEKTNTEFGETKITRLKYNLVKNLSPRKKVSLIIPKPLRMVSSIVSEEKLLQRKPKSRIEEIPLVSESPLHILSEESSSSSTVNVSEDFLSQNDCINPLTLKKEELRGKEYFRWENICYRKGISVSNITLSDTENSEPNFSSSPKKQTTKNELNNPEIDINCSVPSPIEIDAYENSLSEDELPDLLK
ncbi:UNVERIFIED_CONTAM: hypothetical protein RMT77_015252 [Armadillidium vulgare]